MNIPYKMQARFSFFCFNGLQGCCIACIGLLFGGCNGGLSGSEPVEFKAIQITYPQSYKDSAYIDSISGRDPYRWMENSADKHFNTWTPEQQSITQQYFNQIPYRQAIAQRLMEVDDYQRQGLPYPGGSSYWWETSDAKGNKTIYSASKVDQKGQIVLNSNTLNYFFNKNNISEWAPSPDGKWLALASPGIVRIWDIRARKMLADSIGGNNIHGIKWLRNGFFYCATPGKIAAAHQFQQVFYHKPGNSGREDELIYADRSAGGCQISLVISPDMAWLALTSTATDSRLSSVYVKDLTNSTSDFIPIIEKTEALIDFAGIADGSLLFNTRIGADKGNVVGINPANPQRRFWKTLVPQSEALLLSAFQVQNKLVAVYRSGGEDVARIFHLNGQLIKSAAIPKGMAFVDYRIGRAEEAFLLLGSFTRPDGVARLDISTASLAIVRSSTCNFDDSRYTSIFTMVEAPDGVRLPVYLVHRKGLAAQTDKPVLLTGYGAMGKVLQPSFDLLGSPIPALVLENGGIFAVACVRGGGELGEKWHQAGQLASKQHSFDDFQAVARYLIDQGITQPQKLTIWTQAQGALLGGACLSENPNLFKAVILADGPQDMLRYHLYEPGAAWGTEYGTAGSSAQLRDLLKSYSPVHNIVGGKYPATLLISGAIGGPEAAPHWHSYKLTAALQEAQQDIAPILWYPAKGKNKTQWAADAFAFLWYNLQENVNYPLR